MNSSLKIRGCKVHFPPGKKPFPAQVAVMGKVIESCQQKKNALLESPTGTGKVSYS